MDEPNTWEALGSREIYGYLLEQQQGGCFVSTGFGLFPFQLYYLIGDNYSAGWLWKYISFLQTSSNYTEGKKKKVSAEASAFNQLITGEELLDKNPGKELKRSVGREGMTTMTRAALSLACLPLKTIHT